MRRGLRFLNLKSDLWLARQTSRVTESESLNEGLVSYAQRQSVLQSGLAIAFANDFENALKPNDFTAPGSQVNLNDDDGDGDDDWDGFGFDDCIE